MLERFEPDPKEKGRACPKGDRQKVALVVLCSGISGLTEGLSLGFPLVAFLDPMKDESR